MGAFSSLSNSLGFEKGERKYKKETIWCKKGVCRGAQTDMHLHSIRVGKLPKPVYSVVQNKFDTF